MVNYSNTKIYKIWSTQGPMIYVSSTTKNTYLKEWIPIEVITLNGRRREKVMYHQFKYLLLKRKYNICY